MVPGNSASSGDLSMSCLVPKMNCRQAEQLNGIALRMNLRIKHRFSTDPNNDNQFLRERPSDIERLSNPATFQRFCRRRFPSSSSEKHEGPNPSRSVNLRIRPRTFFSSFRLFETLSRDIGRLSLRKQKCKAHAPAHPLSPSGISMFSIRYIISVFRADTRRLFFF